MPRTSQFTQKRARSQSELQAMQADTNKNVNWISSPFFWLAYVLLLASIRLAIYLFTPPNNEKWGWTLLNLAHGAVSFYALHWKRGSPIWEDQGEYIKETVWEQVDNGVAFTDSRKFLTLIPCFLFILSAYSTQEDMVHLCANVVILLVLIVPKMPALEGVRLFGVNKGPEE